MDGLACSRDHREGATDMFVGGSERTSEQRPDRPPLPYLAFSRWVDGRSVREAERVAIMYVHNCAHACACFPLTTDDLFGVATGDRSSSYITGAELELGPPSFRLADVLKAIAILKESRNSVIVIFMHLIPFVSKRMANDTNKEGTLN